MRHLYACALSAAGAAMCVSTALAGPDWIEGSDAGSLPGSEQVTSGGGPLDSIAGMLDSTSGDEQDMYRIYISNPAIFTARTTMTALRGGIADFDTQLFLFAPGGHALLANDNHPTDPPGSRLLPFANDGTSQIIPGPGEYLIAVSPAGSVPVSAGGELFNIQNNTEVSGPDGPGAPLPISNWLGHGETGPGLYIIHLEGAERIPAPGGAAALGLALLVGSLRRRR